MTQGDRISMSNSVQEALRQYQDYLFKICSFIIKSGAPGRRGVLDWFSAVLAQNVKRKALQVDPDTVASDGFMCNVVAVLNKFAEPFVGIKTDKVYYLPDNVDDSSTKLTSTISVQFPSAEKPLALSLQMKPNSKPTIPLPRNTYPIQLKTSIPTSSAKSSS